MVVIILEKVSNSLKGELTRWMLEPRQGVFIGNFSAVVRDKLWETLLKAQDKCEGGIMFYTTNTEQGYGIATFGDTKRVIADFEGLKLVKVLEKL